jgi:HNH endonuclease
MPQAGVSQAGVGRGLLMRLSYSSQPSVVEAAHLVPFNVTRDDNPNNGLALCPNHHRAMDRFLIAPGSGRGQNSVFVQICLIGVPSLGGQRRRNGSGLG